MYVVNRLYLEQKLAAICAVACNATRPTMITKIKRQECLELFPIFPTRVWNSKLEQYDAYFADNFGGYILSVLSKSYRGHIKCLAAEITNLTKSLNSDSLIFLCDIAIPWLKRDSVFKQAKE